jgi:hypothetical protein
MVKFRKSLIKGIKVVKLLKLKRLIMFMITNLKVNFIPKILGKPLHNRVGLLKKGEIKRVFVL